jgi:hypothetical protein
MFMMMIVSLAVASVRIELEGLETRATAVKHDNITSSHATPVF